ncbi:hypothetical protein QQF64_010416 [Cirrhinus molitorella]|uniref:Uncharacterized protein n=1 Tax=Cirrhinus molitorella TaxID=172907 RepID=A0ABR3M739_9TELE
MLGSSKGAGERVIVLPDISHYPFSSQRGAEHQRGGLKSLSLLTSTYLRSVVSLLSAPANSCNSKEELLTVLCQIKQLGSSKGLTSQLSDWHVII